MNAPARKIRGRMTEEELADGFQRLVSNQWRRRESSPFTRRVKAAPAVAAPFLMERLRQGTQRERELATALLTQLEGPRVIAPLWDAFDNELLPQETRVAAATVLEALGEAPAERLKRFHVQDAQTAIDGAIEAIFHKAHEDEAFRQQFIASLEADDADESREIITTLAEPRDERALTLLLPLLFSRRYGLVATTIDALERVGSRKAAPRLEELATGHRSQRSRRQARAALGRLVMQAPLIPVDPPLTIRHAPSPSATQGIHYAAVSLVDQNGDQAIVVSRPVVASGHDSEDRIKVVTILISDTVGVKACTGIDQMRHEELQDVIAAMAGHGVYLVEADLSFCRDLVQQARSLSLKARRPVPLDLEIWSELLEAPCGTDQAIQPKLWEEEAADPPDLLQQTDTLLATPEFRQWFFEPGLVWPYIDEWHTGAMEAKTGHQGLHTLDALIEAAAKDLIDDTFRDLLRRRLTRQAQLLTMARKSDLAALTAAAAHGLDPEHGVPTLLHPFVRAMIMSSFLNAGLRLPTAYGILNPVA